MMRKKILVKSICALLLAGSVVTVGSFAQAATEKVVENRMSNFGSLVDQTSKSTRGAGAGSQTVYQCTNNGSNATKFIYNVMSKKKPNLSRHVDGYLRVGGSEAKVNLTQKVDFGKTMAVKEKGAGEIGSYIQEMVDGNFVAGITLAGY